MLKDGVNRWSTTESEELYEVANWGNGYFSVGPDGNLLVHPTKRPDTAIDMMELVDRLQLRGLKLPILVRFNDIIHHRLDEIHQAFQRAIGDHDYQGQYCCVYPIKVNQQRQVVQQVIEHGRQYGFGLEAGSKPELFAVVALADAETPIICNGFKDLEFIAMALLAQRVGRRVIPVVEKYTELELILREAEHLGIEPQIGIRVKLAAHGAGRWQSSGGYRSKFGLTITEILNAIELLQDRGMLGCLKLLHFHLGSQITNIRQIKRALTEASRIYVDLSRRGAGLELMDVGGGLGVDYDGSQTSFESSVNYTLQEYANDVIHHIQTVCDDAGVAHPTVISESGRAIVAYHSVLVFEVLGVSNNNDLALPEELSSNVDQAVRDLAATYNGVHVRNLLESFHDAQLAFETAINAFSSGYLPLEQRSIAENLFWSICHRIRGLARQLEYVSEELHVLDSLLSETYFCNFSIFQSIPDSWAVKQLFPVMPIHRLDEEPAQQAVLGDITCDSDGKINRFIDRRDVRKSLPVHAENGRPYYLGAFLVGAYQEILGDLHNLFGDTNAVHVRLDGRSEAVIETIVKGDTVSEVLEYVQFSEAELIAQLQTAVEQAVRNGAIDYQQAGEFLKFYETQLHGYTYLDRKSDSDDSNEASP